MDALYCIAITLALALSLRWAVMRQLDRWESAEYFRRYGVIIKHPRALDVIGDVVGSYLGAPIYGSVGFKGMVHEFAGVVPANYQRRIDANELYLDSGLLYVMSGELPAPAHRARSGASGIRMRPLGDRGG